MDDRQRLTAAWQGRVSGCQLGKAVEVFSMREGQAALQVYLEQAGALPLRDYVPFLSNSPLARHGGGACCRGRFERSAPDDDVHYSILALMMLEAHGIDLTTDDVARTWLNLLPVGMTFTAERAAYRILLERGHEWFAQGSPPGFDVTECADNPFNDWIGAQIRADVYGWTCRSRPRLAAELARRDAALSHRGDGIFGAMFVAALGALLWHEPDMHAAITAARALLPPESGAGAAVELGLAAAGAGGDRQIREKYADLSPVHVLNNLALVVWALASHPEDYSAAVGDVVAAGLDTDCNAATVGGLLGLKLGEVPAHWTAPWRGRIGLGLAGHHEVGLENVVARTLRLVDVIEEAAGSDPAWT